MDQQLANLSLVDDEEDQWQLGEVAGVGAVGYELCLVGRFLTASPINFQAMRNALADLWHPLGGVNITEVRGKRFLFRFFYIEDVDRVMDGTPWTFNRHLLILHRLTEGEDPANVSLEMSDFLVQVHQLPAGFVSERIAMQFGNFIGSFVHYDAKAIQMGNADYMRIRVTMDVRQPLKRRKKIVDPRGNVFYATFKYERIPVFCFLCGRLGHNDSFCMVWIERRGQELKLDWDASLRAGIRRRGQEVSAWLWDGNGDIFGGTSVGVGPIGKDDSMAGSASLGGTRQHGQGVLLSDGDVAEEKEGGAAHPQSLFTGFREALADCALHDLGCVGYMYTWERGRNSPRWTRERLDRAVVSLAWSALFPKGGVSTLATPVSDHELILIDFLDVSLVARRWKFLFNNMWLRDQGLPGVVERSWHSGVGRDILTKWVDCCLALARWGRECNCELVSRKQELTRQLQRYRGNEDGVGCALYAQAKIELSGLMAQEEIHW
ncbi:hypothetical protein K2173_024049 [Erythroxylum novogranatense]|uniref:DUF4283 domain-containing protein n=1 Tax=Erythroxylum novogranatense TaxID=1862640 RepID=A0AAV8TTF8_9ROSI|nr:hypothetical protein K2173_024049 [Erythroxylum novogranatense]